MLHNCKVFLLRAGIFWLAGTTSITDLMINGVAMVTIINVDEKLFSALMPKRIQEATEELYVVTFRGSKQGSQVEPLGRYFNPNRGLLSENPAVIQSNARSEVCLSPLPGPYCSSSPSP